MREKRVAGERTSHVRAPRDPSKAKDEDPEQTSERSRVLYRVFGYVDKADDTDDEEMEAGQDDPDDNKELEDWQDDSDSDEEWEDWQESDCSARFEDTAPGAEDTAPGSRGRGHSARGGGRHNTRAEGRHNFRGGGHRRRRGAGGWAGRLQRRQRVGGLAG